MTRVGWEALGRWRLALLFGLLAAPAEVDAQLPLSVWARPLLAVPVGEFAGQDEGIAARPSFGFDAGGSLTLGALQVYGEYQEVRFSCGECAEAQLEDVALDRGWGAGVVVPTLAGPFGFAPWGRLGVIGHHLRFRSGDEAAYSGRSLGWEAGVGADIRPLRWLVVEPAVLWRSYDGTFGFSIEVPDRDLSISYLSFGLGLTIEL